MLFTCLPEGAPSPAAFRDPRMPAANGSPSTSIVM